MKELLYKIALVTVPPLYHALTSLLFVSCRVSYHNLERRQRCIEKGPFIGAFWHFSTYFIIPQSRGLNMTAMVSGSRDGEFMSRYLQLVGQKTVRGSRNKGGLDALKEMTVLVKKEGSCAGIVADGSQGPPLVAQAGAVLLASRTGAPIVPMTWAADRYFTFRSWDRSILPKPFAKIDMCYGEPIYVPAGIRSGELEKYRLELETRLNDLYKESWARFGKEGH